MKGTWYGERHVKFIRNSLVENWHQIRMGPFRVVEELKNGGYQLTYTDETIIPNTWNAS